MRGYALRGCGASYLAGEDLLGDDGRESAKEVTLAVNHNRRRRDGGHCRSKYLSQRTVIA